LVMLFLFIFAGSWHDACNLLSKSDIAFFNKNATEFT